MNAFKKIIEKFISKCYIHLDQGLFLYKIFDSDALNIFLKKNQQRVIPKIRNSVFTERKFPLRFFKKAASSLL
jgi:hypothetical protein